MSEITIRNSKTITGNSVIDELHLSASFDIDFNYFKCVQGNIRFLVTYWGCLLLIENKIVFTR